jgi:hypothetical protein
MPMGFSARPSVLISITLTEPHTLAKFDLHPLGYAHSASRTNLGGVSSTWIPPLFFSF